MAFTRLRMLLKGKRRFRDAAFARPDMASQTEPSFFERVMRAVRRREVIAYDEREARAGKLLRLALLSIIVIFLLWFVARSVQAVNIFAG